MKLETKYILSFVLFSIGLFIWYKWYGVVGFRMLGGILIFAPSFIIDKDQYTESIKFKIPNWNAQRFFRNTSLLLIAILLFVLVIQLGEDWILKQMRTWYIVGILWLACLSGLISGYLRDKKEITKKTEKDQSEKVKQVGLSEAKPNRQRYLT